MSAYPDPNVGTLEGPSARAVAVAPDDVTDLTTPCRGLYIGTGGDLRVGMLWGGAVIDFKNCPAGLLLPIRVKRVYATATSAADIVALI